MYIKEKNEKLPRSLLSYHEWKKYASFFDDEGKLVDTEKNNLLSFLNKMRVKYKKGESPEKCPICGNRCAADRPVCPSCIIEMFDEGHIRLFNVPQPKGKLCRVCGTAQAASKGMCRACYHKRYNEIRKSSWMAKIKEQEDEDDTLKKVQW